MIQQVIGPDGIPIPTLDPMPMPGHMPGIYSMHLHHAVDAASINMEAHLAMRAATRYIRPDHRVAQEEVDAAFNEDKGRYKFNSTPI